MKILKIKVGDGALQIKDCRFSSVRGLMFNDLRKIDGALIYANNVWMPFVRHNLDLFFLDKDGRVLEIQKAAPMKFMKPGTWKIYKNGKAKYCLEIRAGLARIKKGAKLKLNT